MNYDFDKRIDRKDNNAVKWEKCNEKSAAYVGCGYGL